MSDKKIAVLGLGNVLLRDEGAGIKVIEELQNRYTFSPPVPLIDGGTIGFGLINEVQDCTKLIVIDAVKAGEAPGTIYRFTKKDIARNPTHLLSAHDIGFLEVLEQWRVLKIDPEVVFLGIEPEDMSAWDTETSECVRNKTPKLVALVVEELVKEGVAVEKKTG